MPNRVTAILTRIRAYPIVTILLVLSAILIGLANAGTALETVAGLWRKWTQHAPALDTTWQGIWKKPNGYAFSFVMRLKILPNNSATGEIRWTLISTPPGSFFQNRINDQASEFVSGTYIRDAHVVQLHGYEVSDPTLLVTDDYNIQILSDNVSFKGVTRNSPDVGEWAGEAQGTVIMVPQRNR